MLWRSVEDTPAAPLLDTASGVPGVGHASVTSADKMRHTCHLVPLLGKAEAPPNHVNNVRQKKNEAIRNHYIVNKIKLCLTLPMPSWPVSGGLYCLTQEKDKTIKKTIQQDGTRT